VSGSADICDSDLFEKVRHSSDVRLKYTIYKTNADFLLISIGIFRNADATRPGSKDALIKDNEEPELRERLRDLAKKIQKLDETFRFTIDQI